MRSERLGLSMVSAFAFLVMGCMTEAEFASESVNSTTEPLVQPIEVDDGTGGGAVARTWWPQPTDGQSYGWTTGEDRGDCLLLCTKGNYNQAFKRNLCNAGKSPGVGPVFYDGHYQFWGLKWDKMGTGQDHQGVCVTTHVADVGGTGTAASRRIFHDGCTGFPDGSPRKMTQGANAGWTPSNWGQAFHGACIIHDLCYKAEPAFSGMSKSGCDDQMEIYAKQICRASYGTGGGGFLKKNDIDKCLAEAENARFWLKSGSDDHYTAFNYPFDWRPVNGLCGSGKTYNVVTNTCITTPTTSSGGGSSGSGTACGTNTDSVTLLSAEACLPTESAD